MSSELSYEKKFSVIVPCYNVEQYLPKCLDSLVNQTLDGVEVICINDGSPDRCIDILREYERRYPDTIVVIDKENEGVWRGRWDGIAIARGEYIGFVDSDDYVEPDFAECLYSTAKLSNADLSVCGFRRIDLDTGKVLSREMCSPRPSFTFDEDPGRMIELNGAPWNKAFRATALRRMHDLSCPPPVLDDLLFHLLAYLEMHGTVVFSPKPLINYMVRSGSIINSITVDKVEAAQRSFSEVRSFYVQDGASPAMLTALDTDAFLHLGVSMIFRLSYDKSLNLNEQVQRTTKVLNSQFPTWNTSPYLQREYVNSRGGAFKKLRFAKKMYDAHLMPLMLSVYRFMIEKLGHDIKW